MNLLSWISNVWNWIHANPIVAYLLLVKILRSAQDAIDAKPAGLKPPFGTILYYLNAMGQDLGWGNRPTSITSQNTGIPGKTGG